MVRVGVRELRDHLSDYLSRVRGGELLVVTDRGEPLAEIAPIPAGPARTHGRALVRERLATWEGGKPRGLTDAPRPRRGLVSAAVIEDRG